MENRVNCKRCGYCCTLVPKITFLERLRIMFNGYSGFSEKDIKGYTVMKLINGDCYFLERKDGKTSCKIYKIRPRVCREFPKNGICDKRKFIERIKQ